MNTHKMIIDRFEGEYVICESKNKIMIELPRVIFDETYHEGDFFSISLEKNEEETEIAKKRISEKMNRLWMD